MRSTPLLTILAALSLVPGCLELGEGGHNLGDDHPGDDAPEGPPGRSIPPDVISFAIVVDGLEREYIDPVLMPNLSALIDGATGNATVYTSASASMVTETLPNHVGMMTGLPPGEHGIVANTDRHGVTMQDPAWIRTPTIIDAIEAQRPELTTAVVVGWVPLVEIFDCTRVDGVCAPSTDNPEGIEVSHVAPDHLIGADTDPASWTEPEENAISEPLAESTHDRFVIDQVIALLDGNDPPDTFFINLPIVDSMEHLFGAQSPEAFSAVIQADAELGRLIDHLRDTDRWERSVLIVTADHSFLDLDDLLITLPGIGAVSGSRVVLDEKLVGYEDAIDSIITHAGSASVYLTDPGDLATTAAIVAEARGWRDVVGRPSIAAVYCRLPVAGCDPLPAAWGPFSARLGELMFVVDDQHVLLPTHAHLYSALMGHHGGPTALPIPLIVGSGGDFVRHHAVDRAVTNRDLAPTLGYLHGIDGPGGEPFPGRPRADHPSIGKLGKPRPRPRPVWSEPLREAFR